MAPHKLPASPCASNGDMRMLVSEPDLCEVTVGVHIRSDIAIIYVASASVFLLS